MIPIAAHNANNSSIELEALLGVIIIVVCVVYVIFGDKILAAVKRKRR